MLKSSRNIRKALVVRKMKDYIVILPTVTVKEQDGQPGGTVNGCVMAVKAGSRLEAFNKATAKFREDNGIPANVTILSTSVQQVEHEIGATR